MKKMIIPLLVLMSFSFIVATEKGHYYYYKGEKVFLDLDTNAVYVKLTDTSITAWEDFQNNFPQIVISEKSGTNIKGFKLFQISNETNYDDLLSSLSSDESIQYHNPVFRATDSLPLLVLESFVCKFHSDVGEPEIQQLINEYKLKINRRSKYIDNEYLFSVTDSTELSAVETANVFYELGIAQYSEPNFYAYINPAGYTISDEYYEYQWNIEKVVGIQSYSKASWEITTGSADIIVAIIDDGIDEHEDMDSDNIVTGYDCLDEDTLPLPVDTNEYHGIACAGLIFAMHNNIIPDDEIPKEESNYESIAGISPDCRRMSIRIFDGSGSFQSSYDVSDAINYAWSNGAGVINNSWTWLGGQYLEYIENAIDSAYYSGRGGLGTVIVFSSGNIDFFWGDSIYWPATMEEVLAVGAIDTADHKLPSSCTGDSIDLVAPSYDGGNSGIWSTDREDSLGRNPIEFSNCQPYNDIDYVCDFGYTSAAEPLVSGTAALLLSRSPDLTAQEVMDVLKYSAVTELEWGTITPPDDEYGYGRVNALRALLAVCRGDANNDGTINVGDVVRINAYIYQGGDPPEPHPLTGDANCTGSVNVGDVVYLNNYIHKSGPAPSICYEY
jgi:subtilisin family serine protease